MSHQLRGGQQTEDPRLDRVPQFDPRSRRFSVGDVVPKALRSRGWNVPSVLDQGREGACVGFSWAHELLAIPKRIKGIDNYAAQTIYYLAQEMDEWPGEEYEGTSVLAGAKSVQKLKFITEYRWAFTLEDTLRAVAYEGPVVLGIDWYTGMFNPDSKGYIHPTGSVAGGHAILCSAVHLKHDRVVLHNSWGSGWGMRGKAYLSIPHLEKLLDSQGECCCPMGRKG